MREIQIAYLHRQVKFRDEIIDDQNRLMKFNNVKSQKSNQSIKNLDDLQEISNIKLPIV
jgi:hypothetical protein